MLLKFGNWVFPGVWVLGFGTSALGLFVASLWLISCCLKSDASPYFCSLNLACSFTPHCQSGAAPTDGEGCRFDVTCQVFEQRTHEGIIGPIFRRHVGRGERKGAHPVGCIGRAD